MKFNGDHQYVLAKIGVDTAEKEPSHVLGLGEPFPFHAANMPGLFLGCVKADVCKSNLLLPTFLLLDGRKLSRNHEKPENTPNRLKND